MSPDMFTGTGYTPKLNVCSIFISRGEMSGVNPVRLRETCYTWAAELASQPKLVRHYLPDRDI